MRIAIVSPNQNAYSETFIRAHRDLLPASLFYWHGDVPTELEGHGPLRPADALAQSVFAITFRLANLTGSGFGSQAEALFFRSLQKTTPAVVLAEYGQTGCAVMDVCRRLGIPLVVHFHGYDAHRKDVVAAYGDRYRRLFDYASFLIAVSRPMMQQLADIGAPQHKLVYAPYGPSPAFLDVSPTYAEQSILSVGRFVDKKAPYYLILAWQQVLRNVPDARLCMAGDGPLFDTCRNLARHLGIDRSVEFLGVLTPEQVRQKMTVVRAFAQHSITPSNGDMEGMPVAILEAQAAALSVVSTRHAGIPEAVLHDQTGLLVAEHDVHGMAEAMTRLLTNRGCAARLGQAGRARIREGFSMERHISTLRHALTQACAGR